MRIRRLLSFAAAALLALPVGAQVLTYGTDDGGLETGARLSGGVDWTAIPKKLHLKWDEEVRFDSDFGRLHKLYSSVGATYKLTPWLRAGVYGSLINTNSTDNGWRNRVRAGFDLQGSMEADRWKFSLRERLQATTKLYDVNTYQENATAWALKSRIKASYDIPHSRFEPYAAVELRNTLNAVNPAYFKYNKSLGRWDCTDTRYDDIYINRLRFQAGTGWKLARKQLLDIFVVVDSNWNLDIDTSSNGYSRASGAPLLTLEKGVFAGLGLSFTFKL